MRSTFSVGKCARPGPHPPRGKRTTALAPIVALIVGFSSDNVTIDRGHRRATAAAVPLFGATIATYRTLEASAALLDVAAVSLALAARTLSVLRPLRAIRPKQRYGLVAPVLLILRGLRGSIPIMLAMGLPGGLARSVILAATYVVVLFSVIVQAATISGCRND